MTIRIFDSETGKLYNRVDGINERHIDDFATLLDFVYMRLSENTLSESDIKATYEIFRENGLEDVVITIPKALEIYEKKLKQELEFVTIFKEEICRGN